MKSDKQSRRQNTKMFSCPDGEITIYDFTLDALVVSAIEDLPDDACGNSADALIQQAYAFEHYDDVLRWSAHMAALSPLTSSLWEEARVRGWKIGLGELHNDGYHLDIDRKKLILDHFSLPAFSLGRSTYFRNAYLANLVRGLRDIWHEGRHEPFEDNYGPEDVLMLERIRAADCDTVAILAAWEWRGSGNGEIWRHMLGSPEGDMATIFVRFLERDPTALYDGSALAYAFRQWYVDHERVDSCDHMTLENLDDIILGDDGNRQFGSEKLDLTVIEELSLLPDGVCYLARHGQTIMDDPFFSGLKDQINQAHLFHLIYDLEVTMVNNVPFRDKKLARMIFPHGEGQAS